MFMLRVTYFTARQLQSTYQNTRQTLGFQKNIVSKIPPGGANVFLALSLFDLYIVM